MRRWWAFAPFVGVGVLHIVALVTGPVGLAVWSKFAIMPALLLALLVSPRGLRTEVVLWAGLAVAFSWAGDVLLAEPGELGFLIGLACFLFAHVSYLVLYARPLRRRRLGWWALVFLPWWAALLALLLPHAGALAAPVAIYGLVLCAAAAAALGTTPTVGTGAVLFLVSDSLLALRYFLPGFALWNEDAVIMTFYIAGQGLVVAGAVGESRRLAAVAPVA